MVFKDSTLLQEAYISAIQKSVNVPSDTIKPSVDMIPTNDVSISNETPIQPDGGCGCGGSTEDDDKNYMAMSNLFSVFSNAKKLHQFLMQGVEFDEWMVQKIAVCADNLESVMRSANYDAAKSGIGCD
jgi:hypothetical protein